MIVVRPYIPCIRFRHESCIVPLLTQGFESIILLFSTALGCREFFDLFDDGKLGAQIGSQLCFKFTVVLSQSITVAAIDGAELLTHRLIVSKVYDVPTLSEVFFFRFSLLRIEFTQHTRTTAFNNPFNSVWRIASNVLFDGF